MCGVSVSHHISLSKTWSVGARSSAMHAGQEQRAVRGQEGADVDGSPGALVELFAEAEEAILRDVGE